MKHKKDSNTKKNNKNTQKKSIKSFFIKLFISIFIIGLIVGICFLCFKLYTFQSLAKEMFNNSPSTVYDSNKKTIAQIGNERNRENVELSEIPEQLKNAYISIEDQRFYSHHGVDIKRTLGAILSYIRKFGSASFGGSTITQQLVKNLTGDNSNSILRKIKEWFYAWTLEATFSKDDILEAYFNIIYTGPNIYGVKEASLYYFNKDLNDLSLAECSFLAGINNSPNSYNPFSDKDRTEKITNRCKTVLNKMLELNYISEDEYNNAVQEVSNLKFSKNEPKNNSSVYSYHTDALINEVISDLSQRKYIPKDFAENFLYLSGSSIYSTENIEIQDTVEKETMESKYILKSSNGTDTSQAAVVLIDQSNGNVIACSRWFRRKENFKSI